MQKGIWLDRYRWQDDSGRIWDSNEESLPFDAPMHPEELEELRKEMVGKRVPWDLHDQRGCDSIRLREGKEKDEKGKA